MAYIVELTPMQQHIAGAHKEICYTEQAARSLFNWLRDEHNLEDKTTFGNMEAGGIGHDYRLTVTATAE